MQRVLEPEIMADSEQTLVYARADFSTSNQWFVDHLVERGAVTLRNAVDLGCGPGDVMLRLARACPDIRITAVDGSPAMIALARQAVAAAGFEGRISAIEGYIPGLALPEQSFEAVLSKDLLHHLPDPSVLWQEAARLGRPGAPICVMDLIRPASQQDAHEIVEAVAGKEPPLLKADFYNSLCAAFTLDEAAAQVRQAGLDLTVRQVSARHMVIEGALP
jgi:ubiquinone/menaquinone biosynthesis C-methylase UbiE